MALGDGTGWDETLPSNNTDLSDGDDHILDIRKGVNIRMSKQHVAAAAASVGGEHTYLTLQTQATKPTLSGLQTGGVYLKSDGGDIELFYEDDGGVELQLTKDGAINVSLAAAYPTGWVYGGVISNSTGDVTNDLDITACYTRDTTDAYNLVVPAYTKRIDATFVAGAAGGMLDSGSIGAVGDVIYIFAISKAAGADPDFLASKSRTAPTMPATYTLKRLIGHRYWTGSAWSKFVTIGQDNSKEVFFWTPITALTSGAATSFTNLDFSSYVDGNVASVVDLAVNATGSGNSTIVYARPDGSSAAIGDSTAIVECVADTASLTRVVSTAKVPLTTSGIFEYAVNNGTVNIYLRGYREDL